MSNPPTPIRYVVTLDPERTEPAFAELAALDRSGLVRMQAVPAAPATPPHSSCAQGEAMADPDAIIPHPDCPVCTRQAAVRVAFDREVARLEAEQAAREASAKEEPEAEPEPTPSDPADCPPLSAEEEADWRARCAEVCLLEPRGARATDARHAAARGALRALLSKETP